MLSEKGLPFILSGRVDGICLQDGGLLLGIKANKTLCECDLIEERLLYAQFKSSHDNISMFVRYALINDAPYERKDSFYEKCK